MSLIPQDPASAISAVEDDNVCTPEHCFYAFDAIYCALTGDEPIDAQFADEKYPLFITWNTMSRSSKHPRLRGCIGTFEPHPLKEGLAEYALISAFKDTRFRRVEKRELPSLQCVVSLLTDFEDGNSYLDWTVGVHGIHISFTQPTALTTTSSSEAGTPRSSSHSLLNTRLFNSRRPMTATYLPEVAPEQGWDKIESVDSAIRKAGWDGRITEDLRRSIKLRRYQSRKCTVDWDDYVEWRTKNGGGVSV